MSNSSIWPIDRTLSCAATPDQSGPGSNGNEEKFHIPQGCSITGVSPSYFLVTYPGHSLGAGAGGCVIPLQKCSRCILPPQLTKLAISRNSFSLFRFPFCNHVYFFLCAILLICFLKYPYSCFSSHFCFLIFVVFLSTYIASGVIGCSN